MQIVEEPKLAKIFDSTAPILVRGAMCDSCKAIVYSRCATDRRTCICGSVSLAGGVIPKEMTCSLPMGVQWINIALDRDLNDLYYDWNLQVDRYGIIYPRGHRKYIIGMKYVMSMWVDNGMVFYEKGVEQSAKASPKMIQDISLN